MTIFSDQQEISTILQTLFYKSTLINERVKNQNIEIEIHQNFTTIKDQVKKTAQLPDIIAQQIMILGLEMIK